MGQAAKVRHAEKTVAQAVPERTVAYREVYRDGGCFAPAKPAEETAIFDGRRDENVSDTRTLSGEAARGERTVAPCSLAAVQACIEKTNSGIETTWCAGF